MFFISILSCGAEIASGVQNPRMSYMVGGLKVQEILETVVYHHAHGHIHRDVKAGNILVDSNGATMLADVGVFAHPCSILGIGSTQEILLLELLTGLFSSPGIWRLPIFDLNICYHFEVRVKFSFK